VISRGSRSFGVSGFFVEENRMHSRLLKASFRVLILALMVTLPAVMVAQVAPAAKGPTQNDSRWDIFGGYSYLYLPPSAQVNGHPYQSNDFGLMGSVARYFNRNIGLEWNMDTHPRTEDHNDGMWGGQTGLIYRVPMGAVTPFVHGLIGFQHVGGPYQQGNIGADLAAGGGIDFRLSNYVSWRFFEGEYQYSHVNFGVNGRGNFNEIRMSDGLVFHFGSVEPPPPVTLACAVSPSTPIFPGDPLSITATAGSLDPKDTAIYAWSGTGVTGSGNTATVATGTLAPGSYTVKATVVENKPPRHGLAALCDHCGGGGVGPRDVATCSASFTVKEFEPPTLSCSANPTQLKPGDPSVITSNGVSPQNRPLTYSYSATAGSISGTGSTANYDSTGAPIGDVGITCSVSDDKGHTVTAQTGVTILKPYVPPPPVVGPAVCTLDFSKDKKRPTRVDNEAKACLDQLAIDLQNQANATAVVVGESDAKEKAATAKEEKFAERHKKAKVEDSAAQRAVDTKEYLVTDKQIDASRISVATGSADAQTVETYLVPAGATFTNDVHGTTPVDETTVKPIVRKPLPERHHKPHPVGSVKPPAPNNQPAPNP
jgi:hypothetical protein